MSPASASLRLFLHYDLFFMRRDGLSILKVCSYTFYLKWVFGSHVTWNSAVPDPNVWCCILLFLCTLALVQGGSCTWLSMPSRRCFVTDLNDRLTRSNKNDRTVRVVFWVPDDCQIGMKPLIARKRISWMCLFSTRMRSSTPGRTCRRFCLFSPVNLSACVCKKAECLWTPYTHL